MRVQYRARLKANNRPKFRLNYARLSLCLLTLTLTSACASYSRVEADHIKIAVTRLTVLGVAASWNKVEESYSHCEDIFNQFIEVKLKLISQEDRLSPFPVDMSQHNLFWKIYQIWPFSNNSQIWLVVAPFFSGNSAGLATLDSYKSKDVHPLAMVWDVDRYGSRIMGELMAHEICHTVGYSHDDGYEFSKGGINAIHEYLTSLNRKKIRAARRKYQAAREHGTRKEAARWKRVWRLRRQKLFRL